MPIISFSFQDFQLVLFYFYFFFLLILPPSCVSALHMPCSVGRDAAREGPDQSPPKCRPRAGPLWLGSSAGPITPDVHLHRDLQASDPLCFSQTVNPLPDSLLSPLGLEPVVRYTLSSVLSLLAPLAFHRPDLARPQPWINPPLRLPATRSG